MSTLRTIFLPLAIFLMLTIPARGQSALETGRPYQRNYLPEEYTGHSQVFAITQDHRGVIYAGTGDYISEYDGVSWRVIKTKYATIVRSLTVDKWGRVYVGSNDDFGYLRADSVGTMQYISLIDSVDDIYRTCGGIWGIVVSGNTVYFAASKYIFQYTDGEIIVNKGRAETFYRYITDAGKRIFVCQPGVGMMEILGDTLINAPGTKTYPALNRFAMVPFDDIVPGAMLIGDRFTGLHLYRDNKLEPFPSAITPHLEQYGFWRMRRLRDGNIVLCMLNGGLWIMNPQGEIINRYDKSNGLPEDAVYDASEDAQGGLWVATMDGISRFEQASPIRRLDELSGLEGICQKLLRHQGDLYVGTQRGLFVLRAGQSDLTAALETKDQFYHYPEINRAAWDLLPIGNSLLIATGGGVYQLANNRLRRLQAEDPSFSLIRSRLDSNRVFIGQNLGVGSLHQESPDVWIYEGRVPGIEARVRWAALDAHDQLWFASANRGLFRFPDTGQRPDTSVQVQLYDTTQGLPGVLNNRVFPGKPDPVFTTQSGIYRFDYDLKRFEKAPSRDSTFTNGNYSVHRVASDREGTTWICFGADESPGVGKFSGENNRWQSMDFIRFVSRVPIAIFPDQNKVTWFAEKEILRYDANKEHPPHRDYQTIIRRVSTLTDSLIFNGAYPGGNKDDALGSAPLLPFALNSLRLEFAAPSYDRESLNRYQVFLEGFDRGWSEWTEETRKDYTNLSEGNYLFRARAKNIYGIISQAGVFGFTVLPPWYRTIWAYGIYALLSVLSIVGIVRWRSRQLLREKAELETIIARRTGEVQAQAEQLKELDRLKSRLFANISHEFRTPLTLIMDPLEQFIESAQYTDSDRKLFRMMQRNSGRLLQLINQLLDLSRLESGGMRVEKQWQPLLPVMRGLVFSFESLARRKSIILNFEGPQQIGQAHYDRDKLEKIVTNLLSNAFKFTPEGGHISVAVVVTPLLIDTQQTSSSASHSPAGNRLPSTGNHSADQVVTISVTDSGPGIPADRLPRIFDRFYQVESTDSLSYEGTGIGLALTAELVQLLQGNIRVESTVGQGTAFYVALPMQVRQSTAPSATVSPANTPESGNADPAGTDMSSGMPVDEDAPLILIVEDSDDVRLYLCEHLRKTYRVIEAADGLEGMKIAEAQLPDLIVSDIMMPGMDGYQLCEHLKSGIKTSHIPVILLTARAEDADKMEGLETGADDYLTKPFNARELLTRMRNLIEQRRTLRDHFQREALLHPDKVDLPSMDQRFIRQAKEMVQTHLGDESFSVEQFAGLMMMSRMQLHRKLDAITGMSASRFIRTIRLNHAAQLLQQKAATVTEVAYQVGFQNPAYFSQCFKEQFGVSPSEYR